MLKKQAAQGKEEEAGAVSSSPGQEGKVSCKHYVVATVRGGIGMLTTKKHLSYRPATETA